MKQEKQPITQDRIAARAARTVPKKDDISIPLPRLCTANNEELRIFVRAQWQASSCGQKMALSDPGAASGFLRVAPKMGTVNFKSPDAQVDTAPLWSGEMRIPQGYIGEGNIHIQKPLIFSGNSTDAGFASFLAASFYLDDQISCVLLSIIAGDAINHALIAEGLSADATDAIRRAAKLAQSRNMASVPIHPLTKQVFWESDDAEPMLLITASADRMVGELHRRMMEADSYYIPNRISICVGGTKPGNAGAVYNEIGGGGPVSLIMALPPSRINDTPESIASRLKKTGTIFGFFGRLRTEQEALTHYLNAVPEMPEHRTRQARREEAEAFHLLAEALIERARHYADVFNEYADIDDSAYSATPDYLKAWIKAGQCSESDAELLATHILNQSGLYGDQHPHNGWRQRHLHTAGAKQRLLDALTEAVSC